MKINRDLSLLFLFIFLLDSRSIAQTTTFQKTFGGPSWDAIFALDLTRDSGYIFLGRTVVNPGDSYDVYLIKTDAEGQVIWAKAIEIFGNDIGYAIQETNDGGFIILGESNSNPGIGHPDILLIKTDANGTIEWSKDLGGVVQGFARSIQQLDSGEYIITGFTYNFGAGILDVFLIKTKEDGNVIWTKSYGGSGNDQGNFVLESNDGGFIIAGGTTSYSSHLDAFVLKTDRNGNQLWLHTYGGQNDDRAYTLEQTLDGGFIVAGETNFGSAPYDIYLLKIDSMGSLLWSKSIGGANSEFCNSVHQTPDGGFILGGQTYASGPPGSDAYLVKTDSQGNIVWSKSYGGNGPDGSNCMKPTSDGGFILAGTYTILGRNDSEAYVIKTDPAGNSGCLEKTPLIVSWNAPTVTGNQSFLAFSADTLSPALTYFIQNAAALTSNCGIVGIEDKNTIIDFLVYPNPTNSLVSIHTPQLHPTAIEISDALGRVLAVLQPTSETTVFDTRGLGKGMYFVRVVEGGWDLVRLMVE